jgi:hypothetical protein
MPSAITGNVLGPASSSSAGLVTTAAQTFAGKKTLDGGGLIKADSSGTTIPAGYVGYQVRARVASGSAITLTNNTYADVTSITLAVGTWDISFVCVFTGAVTGTQCLSFIGTATGNSSTGIVAGDNDAQMPTSPTANSNVSLSVPCYRVEITAGTPTYYLKALGLFSTGTLKAFGRISAVLVG